MSTDEQLYFRYLQGENEALDELLIRHKDRLIWFLYGIVKNMDDAEDLMMDTFALLITKKLKFAQNSSFKTWLYGIGRNLARKHVRKKNISTEKMAFLIPEFETDFGVQSDLLSEFVKEQDSKLLYQAMNRLPEAYSTVLYLQYMENLDVENISRIMKKSAKQVYNLTSRAKERLRNELMKE